MSIKGEFTGANSRISVWISELATAGCSLRTEHASPLSEGEAMLWIGAVGPLPVHATRQDGTRTQATFKEPLDQRILDHFEAA